MTDRTAPSSDAAQDSYPFTREWLRWMDEQGHVVTSSAYVKRNPLWAEEDAHTFIAARTDQETDMNPSSNRSRHDELVALLTEIRDALVPDYTIETRTCPKPGDVAEKPDANAPIGEHHRLANLCQRHYCEHMHAPWPADIIEEPPVGSQVTDNDGEVWGRFEAGWQVWDALGYMEWSGVSDPWSAVRLSAPLRFTTDKDRERVGIEDEPTPADDLPGEPVEPGDLRAGDRVAFTLMGERITCTLVSSSLGPFLYSDTSLSSGLIPNVVESAGWRDGISDVRLIERGPRPVQKGTLAWAARERAREEAEIERAPREDEDPDEALIDDVLIERQGDLLRRIANELKGEPDPGSSHGWDDLPRLAAEATSMIEAHRVGIATQTARAEQAEAERDALRERVDDLIRERGEARDEARSVRHRLYALRADVRRDRATFTPSTATAILARDDERAAKGERR